MAARRDLASGLEAKAAEGAMGFAHQGHARFPGRSIALTHVAGQAGGGHISQVSSPPLLRGTTWSIESWSALLPQY